MEKSITYPRHTNWTVKTTTHCQDLIKGKTFPYLTSPCQTFNICNYLLCSNIVKQQLLCFVGKVFQRFQPNMLLVFNSQTLEGDSIPLSKHKSHHRERGDTCIQRRASRKPLRGQRYWPQHETPGEGILHSWRSSGLLVFPFYFFFWQAYLAILLIRQTLWPFHSNLDKEDIMLLRLCFQCLETGFETT